MAGRSRNAGWILVAAGIMAAIVIAGIVVVATGSESSATTVTLEPAIDPGSDPFTDSVAVGAVEISDEVEAVTVTKRKEFVPDPATKLLVATGTAPGLYGGSGDDDVCNPEQLVAFLTAHPEKAAAWASVLGIQPSAIKDYVDGLTPVVLTNDTLVTNHGFRDGRATTLQSVLQAGTAVMVDATGTPRVKCNCGNPLTPAEPVSVTNVRGTSWPGYSPNQVTVVNAGAETDMIRLVDVRTGDEYDRSVGAASPMFVAATTKTCCADEPVTILSTSPDGKSWTEVTKIDGSMSNLAWGNGRWLATRDRSIVESADLKTWKDIAPAPEGITDVAYGNGRWVAVGSTGPSSPDSNVAVGVAYTSTDGRTWTKSSGDVGAGLSVGFGNGEFLKVNFVKGGAGTSALERSTDGARWTFEQHEHTGSWNEYVAYGDGQWVLGGESSDLKINSSTFYSQGAVNVSADGRTWTLVSGQFPNGRIRGVAYGNGIWLATAGDLTRVYGAGSSPAQVFTSADAKTWTKRSDPGGASVDLAFGGSFRAAASPVSSAGCPVTLDGYRQAYGTTGPPGVNALVASRIDPTWMVLQIDLGIVSFHCEANRWVMQRAQVAGACTDAIKRNPSYASLFERFGDQPMPDSIAAELDFPC